MKNILIIAGSDNVGGAGIQADIKTAQAFKCYSATAITAVTAQNTNGVLDVMSVTPQMLDNQLKMITDELEINAVKVGMLFNTELIRVTKTWLNKFKELKIPVVVDPVCVAKSGAKLLKDDALKELKEILKLATIATPNLDEYRLLNLDPKAPPCDIILKRTRVDSECEDTLFDTDANVFKFSRPVIKPEIMHGAGCSFSTAIACCLANDQDKISAINSSKDFIIKAIQNAIESKFGTRLLNHGAANE